MGCTEAIAPPCFVGVSGFCLELLDFLDLLDSIDELFYSFGLFIGYKHSLLFFALPRLFLSYATVSCSIHLPQMNACLANENIETVSIEYKITRHCVISLLSNLIIRVCSRLLLFMELI